MNSSQRYCTIYIVRHGESQWNARGLIQGQSDSLLTEQGERQALLLANELKPIKFDALFSSNLVRAIKTAEIISLGQNLTLVTAKALTERNFGKLEGKSGKQLEILAELQKKADPLTYKSFGIESDEEIITRMFKFLREVAASYLGKTVLVITHGSLIRTLLVHLSWAKLEQLPPRSVGNAAFVKLESDGGNFFVRATKGINFKF